MEMFGDYAITDSKDSAIACRFAGVFNEVIKEHNAKKEEWIEELKNEGIAAAHPDDGWVNRVKNEVYLCYPYFNKSPCVGDKIALGNFDKHRVVEVESIRDSFLGDMRYYKFK